MLNWDAFNQPEEQIAPPLVKAKHEEPRQQLATGPSLSECQTTQSQQGPLLIKQQQALESLDVAPGLEELEMGVSGQVDQNG